MKKGQIFSKSYAGQLLRMRKIEEVGTLVDHIANEGFTSAKRIYEEFGIDFKTIKALRCCQPSVSGDTLGKFAYVIAFYLDLARKEAEGIKYVFSPSNLNIGSISSIVYLFIMGCFSLQSSPILHRPS